MFNRPTIGMLAAELEKLLLDMEGHISEPQWIFAKMDYTEVVLKDLEQEISQMRKLAHHLAHNSNEVSTFRTKVRQIITSLRKI